MKVCAMSQTLLEMTKTLVLTQIQVNGLEDMHSFLEETFNVLFALHVQETSLGLGTVETPARALNWRKSITKDWVTCLVCGARYKLLTVHHLRSHRLDARSYRGRYRIPARQPLAARSTIALRKQIVRQIRPWEKAPTYLKAQEKLERAKQPVVKKTRLWKAPESESASAGSRKRVSRKRTS